MEALDSRRHLLDEVPGEEAPSHRDLSSSEEEDAPARPVVDVAALAAAYERELREKLLSKDSAAFLSSRAWKALAAVGVVVLLLGGLLVMRAKQGGQALSATLDRASRLLEKDTEPARQQALALLSRVVDLESDNPRAWVLIAHAHALRYAEGANPEERTQALAALEHAHVRTHQPSLSLVVDMRVAVDAPARDAAQKALLGATAEAPEAQSLAGELLLAQGKSRDALERFGHALKLSPRNVRALVALGGYYRDAQDPVNALRMYSAAAKLAPDHAAARLGVAESRLMLGQDLEQALVDVEGLEVVGPAPLRERHRLVRGRLMTARGKAKEARAVLAEGAQGTLGYETLLALGEAQRASGEMAAAQTTFEEALKLKPTSDEAKADLGHVLLDRDLEREVLSRVEGEGRQVALVRAAAHVKLGDWKRARAEVVHTRVDDRYPAGAIIALARADVAEGEHDRAVEALSKALAAAKAERATLRTALGLLSWQDKALDKANALLETAAAEDTQGYEASCALGRLLLAKGLPDLAVKPLMQAVERNPSHGEAREALGQALLGMGRTQEALKQYEAWQLDSPTAAAAHKGFALALFHSGRHQGRRCRLRARGEARGERSRGPARALRRPLRPGGLPRRLQRPGERQQAGQQGAGDLLRHRARLPAPGPGGQRGQGLRGRAPRGTRGPVWPRGRALGEGLGGARRGQDARGPRAAGAHDVGQGLRPLCPGPRVARRRGREGGPRRRGRGGAARALLRTGAPRAGTGGAQAARGRAGPPGAHPRRGAGAGGWTGAAGPRGRARAPARRDGARRAGLRGLPQAGSGLSRGGPGEEGPAGAPAAQGGGQVACESLPLLLTCRSCAS